MSALFLFFFLGENLFVETASLLKEAVPVFGPNPWKDN